MPEDPTFSVDVRPLRRLHSSAADERLKAWTDRRHTDPNAILIETRAVRNATVLHVERVRFRGTAFGPTVLELDVPLKNPAGRRGETRFACRLLWGFHEPKTRGAAVAVEGLYRTAHGYSGEVAAMLGPREVA